VVRRAAVAALLLASATACTPTRFRLEPYRHDPAKAALLAGLAAGRCDRRPPHPFTTDGCSMAPDGDIADCCVDHDIAYWCGGTAEQRREADRRLADCVRERGHSRCYSGFVEATVRMGGAPWLPTPWRWGYGWNGLGGGD
jgi:hypothetical protein